MSRRFLTVRTVATRYTVSAWTIYEWARTGLIPCRKINGRLLFAEADLEEWEDGAELEVVATAAGGRICRPARTHANQGRR